MARFVCTQLGFPVFYDDGQGVALPKGAKRISEATFQRFVATGSLKPASKKKGGK